jgi:hypothetical protein
MSSKPTPTLSKPIVDADDDLDELDGTSSPPPLSGVHS